MKKKIQLIKHILHSEHEQKFHFINFFFFNCYFKIYIQLKKNNQTVHFMINSSI